MGYVLTKEDPGGRIYALITPTRLIDYTLDIDTASVFQDKNEAEDLQKRATKKLRGFQTVNLKLYFEYINDILNIFLAE